jgi:hypothetical protein
MVLLIDEAQVKARLVCLEIESILTQDRCMVFAERTIGLEMIFDPPDETPTRRGSCGILLQSVWTQC